MANTIAQLAVKLGLETSEFTQGLNAAKRGLQELSGMMATAEKAVAVAFTAMVYKSLQFSDQMADLADSTQISIASILKISEALELSGGSSEDAGKALSKFTQNIDAAAQGSKTAQESFARAGVSLKDLATLSTEQLLSKTTAGIAKMGDVVAMTGVKVDLFGKGMRNINMESFDALIQKSSAEFEQYADAVSLAADMHDKLAHKANVLMLIFTKEVMPVLTGLFSAMATEGGFADTVFSGMRYTLIGLWDVAGKVSDTYARMAANWKAFLSNSQGSGEHLNTLNQIILNSIKREEQLNKYAENKTPEAKKTVPFGGRSVTEAKDTEADKQKQMLYVATLISTEYQRQVDFSLQQLKTRNAMVGMTNDEKRVQEAINQQLDSTSKKIDEITKLREAAVGRGAESKVLAEYDTQISKVKEIGEEAKKTAQEIELSAIAAQRTFLFGFNKAFAQYAEDAENYAKLSEQSFTSVTSNMNAAIDEFVEKGSFSFSQFTESVIKDLIKIQLRMQMAQLLSYAVKGVGGMFAGSPQYADPAYAQAGFADGGEPPVGVPSLVGERGAELFVPKRPGTIIPNHQLGSLLGGGQTINYNAPYIANMQAIDTQSGIQFLAKNKMTIWSMNQSANRSIPAGR